MIHMLDEFNPKRPAENKSPIHFGRDTKQKKTTWRFTKLFKAAVLMRLETLTKQD
jgi:hypothetical protein